jgi:serine/threonine protein kinase
MSICGNILKIYGMSQNPETNDYIMVLDYAEGGNSVDWINRNYRSFNWSNRIQIVKNIIDGLIEIHQKQIIHRHLHPRNILLKFQHGYIVSYISDMGLYGEVGNIDHSKVYGIMPYVAPEVLRGDPYTQSADIYSFGMIMYFIATGRQPFSNYAHDQCLALDICNGLRPEVNEPDVPRCYIDLMKRCWDSNPDSRPNTKEIHELITLFSYSYKMDALHFKLFMSIEKEQQHYEIENQFIEAEKYRRANLSSNINNQSPAHSRSVYTSRLLNPFIRDLLKHDSSNSIEFSK